MVVIQRMEEKDYEEVLSFWNNHVENENLPYKKLSHKTFLDKFIGQTDQVRKISYIYKAEDEVIGFASGCYKVQDEVGYITFVLVKESFRRRGIGSQLLIELEGDLAKEGGVKRFDIIFFNPTTLEWIVPGTKGHDHPNSPGVDVTSKAYLLFKNHDYRDIAYQNSYYRLLEGFEYSQDIYRKLEELKAKNLAITYYDEHEHNGFEALFDDLGNELWRETIMTNIKRGKDAAPVLVVEHEGKICGFTGPLSVQSSGRGYFAGIGIHSQYRACGGGKVLFSALCKGLKDQGAGYVTLFTGETNPARNIYETAGFKRIKTWANMRKEKSL